MANDIGSYFGALLNEAIENHRKRKDNLRRGSWLLHISAMVLGATSTVLLGLQVHGESYPIWSRNVALVMTAVVSLITGLLSFWNLDSYWLKRKVIYNDLMRLKDRFDYIEATKPDDSEAQTEKLFDDYMAVMNKHTEYWEGLMTKGSKPRSGETTRKSATSEKNA